VPLHNAIKLRRIDKMSFFYLPLDNAVAAQGEARNSEEISAQSIQSLYDTDWTFPKKSKPASSSNKLHTPS